MQHQGLAQEAASLRDWFTQILDSEDDADELIRRCQRIEVDAAEIIVLAGDAANSMHFILDGRVGIMVPAGDGRTTRVRSLGRYTTIGEMGLVSHAPRSATIQAEVASVLYVSEHASVRGDQDRCPRAEPKAPDLLRVRDGRAALVREPHHRGAAAVDEHRSLDEAKRTTCPGCTACAHQPPRTLRFASRSGLRGESYTPAIITYLISTYSSMP